MAKGACGFTAQNGPPSPFVSRSFESHPRRHKRCRGRVAPRVSGVVSARLLPRSEHEPPGEDSFLQRSLGCHFVIAILPRGPPHPPTHPPPHPRESAHGCHTVATPLVRLPRNGLEAGGQTSPRESSRYGCLLIPNAVLRKWRGWGVWPNELLPPPWLV